MPIKGLSEARRVGRDFKIRLGIRWTKVDGERVRVKRDDANRGYPAETDYFVIDEATDEVKKIYGEKPKSLRMALPFEYTAVLQTTGQELVWDLNNRAYGSNHGIRCIGHGRSQVDFDTAVTNDPAWAKRIEEATGYAPELVQGFTEPRWRVRCMGRDCPKYLSMVEATDPDRPGKTKMVPAEGHDRDAACKAIAMLRGWLLHDELDPKSPDYCRALGMAEIATGSINSMIDVPSGFDSMRPYTSGQTAHLPFTLVRKAVTTYRPTKQIHWTLRVQFDPREIQMLAAIPPAERLITDEMRERLKLLAREPLGLTVDSVRDLLPDHLLPAGALEGGNGTQASPGGAAEPPAASPDAPRPDVQLEPGRPSYGPEQLATPLVRAQRDELLQMCGGTTDPEKPEDRITNPWKPQAIERLTGLVKAYDAEHGTSTPKLGSLTFGHYLWIKARVQGLPPVDTSPEVSPADSRHVQLEGNDRQSAGAGSRDEETAQGPAAPSDGMTAAANAEPATTPPPPSTEPARCAICGAVEDADGHLAHDDAKHEEVAAARKRARAEAEGQQRLL